MAGPSAGAGVVVATGCCEDCVGLATELLDGTSTPAAFRNTVLPIATAPTMVATAVRTRGREVSIGTSC